MHSSYACGIPEINALRINKLPLRRKIKPEAITRVDSYGRTVLVRAKSGALYANSVIQGCILGYTCEEEIKALYTVGAISKEALDEYLRRGTAQREQRRLEYWAERLESSAEALGIALTARQKARLTKLLAEELP